jgi:Na+-transporting NADH:ubiquinone oxidoreductase subunit F
MMSQEIFIGVVLFTGTVIILALIIMLVRFWLIPVGQVTILINNNKEIKAPIGSTLLNSLADNQLFVPSACGGAGSCGQCVVRVVSGGGTILPIETSHITRHDAKKGQRLACQVIMDRDMKIEIPDSIAGVKRRECTVRSNNNVSTFIKELVLDLPEGETLDFRAGGFVIIQSPPYHLSYADLDITNGYRDEWQRLGLLNLESNVSNTSERAYSLANYPAENNEILLNVRIATPPPSLPIGTPPGVVSSYIFGLKPNDTVTVMGPFGDFFAKQTNAEMIFVGGGAGMAPMRSHILDQLMRLKSNRRMSFWYGARSLCEAFYVDTFDKLDAKHDNFSWHLALSEPNEADNWQGHVGFIHEVLFENYLKNHPSPEDCEYYLCGPPMMIDALVHLLDELGVEKENIMFDDFGGH